jgi:hypothetical protein
LKKKIALGIFLSALFISSIILVASNSEIRFEILQELGIKLKPKTIDNSYSIQTLVSGLPSPYHIAVIGNDVFFNERFTGNLFVIKNGDLQSQPIINVSDENPQTKIHGIASYNSSIFLHITEADYEVDQYKNNRIVEYGWDGENLILKQEVEPQLLFTDMHHSGGIIVGDNSNIFSTYPGILEQPLLDYYVYGVHGFTFDQKTKNIWHTTEVDNNETWKEIISDTNYKPDLYEKIHIVSSNDMNNHNFWEVPYYPNSLLVPNPTLSQKFNDSIFVGYCKGEKTKGGIYEYPLNSERTDFQIPTSQNNFREIDHEEYLIAENFYCVSDIEPGHDGSLYVTDYTKTGAIYKIVPKS